MTDLTSGAWFADWRAMVDAGMSGCTCRVVSLTMYRDHTGRVTGMEYAHTDDGCAAITAAITDAVEDVTRPRQDEERPDIM